MFIGTYVIVQRGAAILCGRCGLVSHNSQDVQELYCGTCHQFHTRLDEAQSDVLAQALIAIFVDRQPRRFEVVRALVANHISLDGVLAIAVPNTPVTGLNYNAARTTAEWLIACREVLHADRGIE